MKKWSETYRAYKDQEKSSSGSGEAAASRGFSLPLSPSLDDNLAKIEQAIGVNGDLSVRNFLIANRFKAALVFLSSMTDQNGIRENVLKPLMQWQEPEVKDDEEPLREHLLDRLWNETIYISDGQKCSEISRLFDLVSSGYVVLLLDQCEQSIAFAMRQIEKRGIEQPQTEQVIRGAREGFIELLDTNLALIRYRLQTPDLKIETGPVGQRTQSRVAVCYIQGITDPELVSEVMLRISKINFDGIIDAGYIEQFIEDQPISPFPQIQNTERPDKTVAALLEGRVVIMVDGSSFALIIPALLDQFFQTIDDYSERFIIGSLVRFIRLIALLFSLFFPSLYVSVISYNPELLPTDFAVAISGGRAGVPFPAVLEVFIMEVSMEILREATIRLPQMIGGALSIVGVLVVGQAAVSAGLASPITVVIVALTTIGSFATPAYNVAIALRMLRFPLIFLAGLFGLYGVMIGAVFIINHLLYLESFGRPYLLSLITGMRERLTDTLFRAPLWWMNRRPSHLHPIDATRAPYGKTQSYIDGIFQSKGNSNEQEPENLNDPNRNRRR
ncbi:spore germination protein [Paenibacillus sp. Marseille-P2973]|uniref:spore germination protein n=1 Tax=Paenibacillus sp. Marseille-P2973 TaxID=1871032 RepID=UPI0032B5C259